MSKLHLPRSPILWPILGLIALVILNLVLSGPGFLRITLQDGHLFGMPIDILNRGACGLLLALGMTLVIATGGIDLSVGSIMAISGSVAAVLLAKHGVSLPVALLAALGISLAAGLFSGVLVARLGLQPIVATLIVMVGGRGVAQLITNGDVIIIPSQSFGFLGNGFLLGVPFAAILATVIYLIAHFFLRRTSTGLFIEAVGDNETAARFAGLATTRTKILVYVFCGVCAGIAGLLAASNIRAADPYRVGEMMELDAIFAVVVGGTALTGGRFLLAGAFVGALLLQTLTITMYNIGVPPAIAPVPKAVIILIVCLAQSETTRRWLRGLFTKTAVRKATA